MLPDLTLKLDLEASHQGASFRPQNEGKLKLYFLNPHSTFNLGANAHGVKQVSS